MIPISTKYLNCTRVLAFIVLWIRIIPSNCQTNLYNPKDKEVNSVPKFNNKAYCPIFLGRIPQPNTFGVGASFDLGLSKFRGSGLKNAKSALAWRAGMVIQYTINYRFDVSSGILLESLRGKNSGLVLNSAGVANHSFNENFTSMDLNFPLYLNYNRYVLRMRRRRYRMIFPKLFVYLGPEINTNLALHKSREYDDEQYDQENGFKQFSVSNRQDPNIAIGGGLGFSWPNRYLDEYFIKLRLSYGLSNRGSLNRGGFRSALFQAGLSYLFR